MIAAQGRMCNQNIIREQEALARCVFPVEFTMLQKFNDEPIVMGVQITEGGRVWHSASSCLLMFLSHPCQASSR